jgi:hypothetical protein
MPNAARGAYDGDMGTRCHGTQQRHGPGSLHPRVAWVSSRFDRGVPRGGTIITSSLSAPGGIHAYRVCDRNGSIDTSLVTLFSPQPEDERHRHVQCAASHGRSMSIQLSQVTHGFHYIKIRPPAVLSTWSERTEGPKLAISRTRSVTQPDRYGVYWDPVGQARPAVILSRTAAQPVSLAKASWSPFVSLVKRFQSRTNWSRRGRVRVSQRTALASQTREELVVESSRSGLVRQVTGSSMIAPCVWIAS